MADGARTHDNRNHNPGLYQLSYSHRNPLIIALVLAVHHHQFAFHGAGAHVGVGLFEFGHGHGAVDDGFDGAFGVPGC